MRTRICLAAAVALLVSTATPALAQGEFVKDNLSRLIRKVGVHVGASMSEPLDSDVTKGTHYGVSVGLSPGRANGWKYPVGLVWFSEELRGPGGNQFGLLQTKAALAGIGYGWHFFDNGRLSTTIALQGGIALNKVKLDNAAPQIFSSEDAKVRLRNSLIARPQLRSEYFLTQKISVRAALSYIYMQPNIEVHTATGRAPGDWNAHNINFALGIGVYPFKKE